MGPSEIRRFTKSEVMNKVALMFGDMPSITTTAEEFVCRLERLLYGKSSKLTNNDVSVLIERMNQYQKDEFEVVSPGFVYEGVGMAAAWKWYIIEFNKDLRSLKNTLEKNSQKWKNVDEMIETFQDYIDAVSSVLEGYYRVDVNCKSSQELFNEIDFFLRTDSKYQTYKEMFTNAERILGVW